MMNKDTKVESTPISKPEKIVLHPSKVKSETSNEKISDNEKFIRIIDTQSEWLKQQLKHGKRVVNEHRSLILQQIRSWLYEALLKKTIDYGEFKYLLHYTAENFSWEKLTGVKQLSIFDDIPDYELKRLTENE